MTGATLQLCLLEGTHRPVTTSRFVLRGRARWILRYRAGALDVASEAAPLSGFGADDGELAGEELARVTVEQVREAVAAVERVFPEFHATHPAANAICPARLATARFPDCVSPSARFCLEALVLRIASQRLRVRLVDLLTSRPVAVRLAGSAVLDPRARDAVEVARSQLAQGVGTLKIKCGVDREVELQTLSRLHEELPELRLRVDANGAWTVEEAVAFMARAGKDTEWFEDPVREPAAFGEVSGRLPAANLAMDEPLSALALDPWREDRLGEEVREVLKPVSVLVLKPMVLGGFAASMAWADLARSLGKRVCVSHLFDGHLALEACVALAFAIQSPQTAAGLGRHAGLASEPERRIEGMKGVHLAL